MITQQTGIQDLFERLVAAEDVGVKLELGQGTPTWEFLPSPMHQMKVRDIDRSIRQAPDASGCGCYTLADTYVLLPDGSLKRPDLMILCERPAPERHALRLVPKAVVEVLSPGFEAKDLDVGAPLYLSNGVLDVVVADPETGIVHHFRRGGSVKHAGPVEIRLECGCVLTA